MGYCWCDNDFVWTCKVPFEAQIVGTDKTCHIEVGESFIEEYLHLDNCKIISYDLNNLDDKFINVKTEDRDKYFDVVEQELSYDG